MRSLRFAVAAATMIASTAMASPADPRLGVEYNVLPQAQPTQQVGAKIEVIEFFAYHCPACNSVEPLVADWVKKQGSNISFKRLPFPFQGPNDPEAHLFLALEAMGKAEEIGPKVFRAVHVERKRLMTDAQILDWVAKESGLNNKQFMEAWNSFGVVTKLKRLPQIAGSYKISGTPEFVIDGRFLTSPSLVDKANPGLGANFANAMKATLDALVAKAQKDKPAAAPAAAAAAAPAKAATKK